jgi:hypothetical protein
MQDLAEAFIIAAMVTTFIVVGTFTVLWIWQ